MMTTRKHWPIMELRVRKKKKSIAAHSGVKLGCGEQAIHSSAFWNYLNTRARVCVCVGGKVWGTRSEDGPYAQEIHEPFLWGIMKV